MIILGGAHHHVAFSRSSGFGVSTQNPRRAASPHPSVADNRRADGRPRLRVTEPGPNLAGRPRVDGERAECMPQVTRRSFAASRGLRVPVPTSKRAVEVLAGFPREQGASRLLSARAGAAGRASARPPAPSGRSAPATLRRAAFARDERASRPRSPRRGHGAPEARRGRVRLSQKEGRKGGAGRRGRTRSRRRLSPAVQVRALAQIRSRRPPRGVPDARSRATSVASSSPTKRSTAAIVTP